MVNRLSMLISSKHRAPSRVSKGSPNKSCKCNPHSKHFTCDFCRHHMLDSDYRVLFEAQSKRSKWRKNRSTKTAKPAEPESGDEDDYDYELRDLYLPNRRPKLTDPAARVVRRSSYMEMTIRTYYEGQGRKYDAKTPSKWMTKLRQVAREVAEHMKDTDSEPEEAQRCPSRERSSQAPFPCKVTQI